MTDDEKIQQARSYVNAWLDKIKINCFFSAYVNAHEDFDPDYFRNNQNVIAFCYNWVEKEHNRWYGLKMSRICVSKLFYELSEQERFHTLRHELAHAICYQKYNATGHGHKWQYIAKMLRVNVRPYLK